MTIYTAVSFAPVQGFIEKSRKLRDLFGASLILSYLSGKLVSRAEELGLEVISPGAPDLKEGMPNRILVRSYIDSEDAKKTFDKNWNRDVVKNILVQEWRHILKECRKWVEEKIPKDQYHWSQQEEDIGKQKGEWERWESYAWEVFWGSGKTVKDAMEALETCKLKRDWIGINWVGESSSLSGTDAIAWHGLGEESKQPWEWAQHKDAVKSFYEALARVTEEPGEQLLGKFLDPSEKLSIPELVKRLVTRYEDIGKQFGKEFKFDSLAEMVRLPKPGQAGHWTGWFMGDGDEIGKKLKELAENSEDTKPLKDFSDAMRNWGHKFQRDFPKDLGRVVYAGGDDFLGVIYSKEPDAPISERCALGWLMELNQQWKTPDRGVTVSVGFVWAGHSVPQRDVLQHCREAEKRSKSLGRDRVTIRVVFSSGQYVQWTCPWDYLDILTKYRDRNGKTWGDPKLNWTHLYSDWAQLKARHAIPLNDRSDQVDDRIALKLFELYFDDMERFEEHSQEIFKKDYTPKAVVEWLDGLVNVGWQLCSNT